jgi:hypothetical protein
MESINSETNLKNIIKSKNLSIDNKNYYLSKAIKFLLNFILMFFFTDYLLDVNPEKKFETVLAICTFSSVLFYILDLNFPSCSINLNNL